MDKQKRRNKTMYCVIMGDIIDSKEMNDETIIELTTIAKNTFDIINSEYYEYIVSPFGLVRGDAFEGVLLSPVFAPEIVQKVIKAFYKMKATKVRIAVSVGNLSIVSDDRNESNGPAFHKAVEEIEKMKAIKSNHWLQVSFFSNSDTQPIIESLFMLLSGITQRWTERQREIVWEVQDYFDDASFASKKLNIPAAVLRKQLSAANYDAYKAAWDGLKVHFTEAEDVAVLERPAEKSYTAYFSAAVRKKGKRLFEEAISLFERALELAENDFCENKARLAVIYTNLAETLLLNQPVDVQRATIYIEKALELQEHLPKSRIEYADTRSTLAEIYRLSGKIDLSEKEYLEAIEIVKSTAGSNHPIFSIFYNNIATTYADILDYKKAKDYYLKALKSFRSDIGNITDKAIILRNIANCCYGMKDWADAVKYIEKALEIFNDVLPPKHDDLIYTKNLLEACRMEMEAKEID